MGFGGSSPFPFPFGGGPTGPEQAFATLKALVGVGGSGPDDGIEGAWRWAKARALAAMSADEERGVNQSYPDRCTDALPVYEEILGLTNAGLLEQERRQLVVDRWTEAVSSQSDHLGDKLSEIDARMSVMEHTAVIMARQDIRDATPGRMFEDYDPTDPLACGPAFTVSGARTWTNFANPSDEFVCTVIVDIDSGDMTTEIARRIERAKAMLCECLPSWCTWRFVPNKARFTLDESLLDFGCF